MTTPIILKVTNAGKNAILDSNNTGITLRLSDLAIGSGQYTPTGNETVLQGEISRHGIVSGNVETQSHTLRFSSSITANNAEVSAYEIGLMTEDNVLFAVASSTDKPLLKVYPDIVLVASFGLTLDEFDVSKITVVNDPNGALSIVLMQQHLASDDPHPQYAKKKGVTDLLAVLQQQVTDLTNRPFEGVPVGGILATTKHYNSGDEVTADLRYGKWARYGQGKVLAGFSLLATDIAEYKTMGNEFGENTHTLTVDEMPSHNHVPNPLDVHPNNVLLKVDGTQTIGGGSVDNTAGQTNITQINPPTLAMVGNNQSHNNLQPSVVVAFWVRMPNDYTAPIFEMFWTTDSEGNNRITSTNEGQELYLWLTAQNLVQNMAIGLSIDTTEAKITINDKANLIYPNSIGNGKARLAYLPADSYVVTANTTLNMGVTMADGTVLSAPLMVNDTVINSPVVKSDSVFYFGLDHNTDTAKLIKTQGDYNVKIQGYSLIDNSGENYLHSIILESDKVINSQELFINAGWQTDDDSSFEFRAMYSGNPSIQGLNNIYNAIYSNISLDASGKIITITAKLTNGLVEMRNPFQLIIGNDIGIVSNPSYGNRYDNTSALIQRPFIGYTDWKNLLSNTP